MTNHSPVPNKFLERVAAIGGSVIRERKRAMAKLAALLLTAISLGVVVLFTAGPVVEPTALAQGPQYVGSERCALCHQAIFDTWAATGHPNKVRTAAEARAAGIPKPGYVGSWDDIFLVVGGFKWKARYIGQDGISSPKARTAVSGARINLIPRPSSS